MSLTASDLTKIERLLSAQNAILTALLVLAKAARTQQGRQPAPDHRYPLAAYSGFDWTSIGAEVAGHDHHGPTVVTWTGRSFTRRNGAGKFGRAIWFSRQIGEEDGHRQYERLVTFKDQDIEPLSFDPPPPAPQGDPKVQPAAARQPQPGPGVPRPGQGGHQGRPGDSRAGTKNLIR